MRNLTRDVIRQHKTGTVVLRLNSIRSLISHRRIHNSRSSVQNKAISLMKGVEHLNKQLSLLMLLNFNIHRLKRKARTTNNRSLLLMIHRHNKNSKFSLPSVISRVLGISTSVTFRRHVISHRKGVSLQQFINLLSRVIRIRFFNRTFSNTINRTRVDSRLTLRLVRKLIPRVLNHFCFHRTDYPSQCSKRRAISKNRLRQKATFTLRHGSKRQGTFSIIVTERMITRFRTFIRAFILNSSAVRGSIVLNVTRRRITWQVILVVRVPVKRVPVKSLNFLHIHLHFLRFHVRVSQVRQNLISLRLTSRERKQSHITFLP